MARQPSEYHVPDDIRDGTRDVWYKKGKFMGKGGFARCFELIEEKTNNIYAGKIVPKALLAKPHHREKMSLEIQIHQEVRHQHIVHFHSFFEDKENVYILLELCRNRSLMELQKRRKALTEPEARYFVKQIVEACIYLHGRNIIHRDLKLSNVFINDRMEVKVGDFGLATRIEHNGQKKKTLCGTPNYLAPEILTKKGHSYEVDIWSVGCILYTLLVGHPPFETNKLQDTYQKIKNNDYNIPNRVSGPAKTLIAWMLQNDPTKRPNMRQVLSSEFFSTGFIPSALPLSCLTMAPRNFNEAVRKPLVERNIPQQDANQEARDEQNPEAVPQDFWLADLFNQLNRLMAALGPSKETNNNDVSEDPNLSPMVWVAKWVDYSDKYGLGYQLNDNSFGVLFNDATKMLLYTDGQNMQYIDKEGTETYFNFEKHPESMNKKITLMEYFKNYMQENLVRTGENLQPRETAGMQRLPWMRVWYRTRSAINMHLTNGTVQINFFSDHVKMILCPLMQAITIIYPDKVARTFKMSTILEAGCTKDLQDRVAYARQMIEKMMSGKCAGSGKLKVSESGRPAAQPV